MSFDPIQRTFFLRTRASLADPMHVIRLSEVFKHGGRTVAFQYAGTWRVRLLCWLIQRWMKLPTQTQLDEKVICNLSV